MQLMDMLLPNAHRLHAYQILALEVQHAWNKMTSGTAYVHQGTVESIVCCETWYLRIQIFWDVTLFCWVSGSWHFLMKFNNNSKFLLNWLFYLDHLALDNEGTKMLQNFEDHSSDNSKTHPQDVNTHQTCYYSVGKVILLHSTKPYVEMEVRLHAFSIFPALDGSNRSGSHPNHFAPRWQTFWYPSNWRLCGPHSRSLYYREEEISCLYQELNHIPPVVQPTA